MGRNQTGKKTKKSRNWAKSDILAGVLQYKSPPPQDGSDTTPQSSPTCGLMNSNNSCYMNAGLQLMASDPVLCRIIEKTVPADLLHQAPATYAFRQFLKKRRGGLKTGVAAPVAADAVADVLFMSGAFESGRQSDCMEFLLFLLNALSREVSRRGGMSSNW
ncbi:uncharacterized protein LOC125179104 [Hyalella azteca]|uniref:ubiquitinyl hydrolase 1 n=1 Tax=Hyalella azteca TaxID=294128 RepID=A0A979FUI3_HYAAZ|nr:uncharacterized protein LOC125179104 [Hyalella azteca]